MRIFLDANVYFAGMFSIKGASAVILELARREKITVYASRLALREAERNLRKKSSTAILKNYHRFLQKTKIHIVRPPDERLFRPYDECIHPKDLPVLVAAMQSGADYLVTLDRRHFMTPAVLSKVKAVRILSSGDFLKVFMGQK